ncbi:MAG: invasion associated locus B family protein, partial [Octadecabacter sp.]|nr:invasion associated locus B family protein [Octadecabacter sp.]
MTFLTSRISKTLSVAALACALGAPTFAQEATQEPTDEPQVETPTQTAEEQPESVFNMGEEVDENGDPVAAEPQEPQPGQQYLSE